MCLYNALMHISGSRCGRNHHSQQPTVLHHTWPCRWKGKSPAGAQKVSEGREVVLLDAGRKLRAGDSEYLCSGGGGGIDTQSKGKLQW